MDLRTAEATAGGGREGRADAPRGHDAAPQPHPQGTPTSGSVGQHTTRSSGR